MRKIKVNRHTVVFFVGRLAAPVFVWLALFSVAAWLPAQTPDLIPQNADFTQRRTLPDHHPLWANPANDAGAVPGTEPLNNLALVLARPTGQEKAFQQFLQEQQEPGSPNYHRWLTGEEIGERFGVSDHDIQAISGWLQSQGLHVDWISPSRVFIGFGGTAGDVSRAFQTEFHTYNVNGDRRVSVSSDPMIPAALAPVVESVRGLFTIRDVPQHHMGIPSVAQPEFNYGGGHYLMPVDFATIYDLPTGYTGAGITIGIVGRSRTNVGDFENFKNITGSTFANPTERIPASQGGIDPGPAYTSEPACKYLNLCSPAVNEALDDQQEATLDVLRAGSVAPGAQVLLVVSANSRTVDGIAPAAQYLVDTSPLPAQIMSISFAACESEAGQGGVNYWNKLFQVAAGEGMSVFGASGDAGASECDDAFKTPPANPKANSPNYICSSWYATCVGGTEFNDWSSPSTYWSSSNSSSTLGSALSYIPEGGWNEPKNTSGSVQAASSGGGVSRYVSTPTWQAGNGVPAARSGRYTPDLAFSASAHDGYYGCFAANFGGDCSKSSSFVIFSGTSAAAPDMAGVTALLDQKEGSAQGNLNPEIYALAANTPSSFHDVTVATSITGACDVNTPSMCNNSIPGPAGLSGGQAGYAVGAGYDEVTGWGSLKISNFLNDYRQYDPTLSVSLTASAQNGAPPLAITLTATIGGSDSGPVNYSFWWNCNDSSTSVSSVESACGQLSASCTGTGTSTGFKCDAWPQISLAASHTYSTAGSYVAKVIVEQGSAWPAESRTTITVSSQANQPDLTETSLSSPPGSMLSGSSFSVTDAVKNIGIASAGSSVTRYYLSSSTSKTSSSVRMTGSRSVPALAAGASSSGTATVTIPSTTKPGTFYFLACADDTGLITESNEGNNCKAASGTIIVTAQGGGTILLGQTVAGKLATSAPHGKCRSGSPADRWKFTLPATTTVTIEADSTAFDTYLCLLDSSDNFLDSDDNSGPGSNARIVYQNLSIGTYYIEVYSAPANPGSGAYTLSLKSGLPPGKAISLGQALSSTLSTGEAKGACRNSTPTDRWKFTLTAATTVDIEADTTAFDTYLCLLDSSDNFLDSDDNSGPGSNARIVYQNLSVGTYYIEVYSAPANPGSGAYKLSLTSGLPPGKAISLGQALSSTLSTGEAKGACRNSTPTDRWKFTLTAATTVDIEADSTAFDSYLCLLDSSDNYLDSDDNSGPGSNARIVHQNLSVGTYYIEVYSAPANPGSGAYTLSLKSGLPPGKAISVGQALSGTLSIGEAKGACRNSTPTDRWKFTLTAATTVTIEADSTAFDTYLCLLDASDNYLDSDDNSGPGSNARIVYQNISVGTYYIEVYSAPSNPGSGAYKLSLTSGLPPGKAISLGQTLSSTLSTGEAKGACRNSTPTDRWKFTLTAAATVTIEADSTAFDTYLCLLDSSDNYLDSDDNSGGGSNARIVYQNLSVGTYYIEVYSSPANPGSGAYKLSLQ